MAEESRNYVIYKHTAPNGKVYIGITGQEPEKRWANGLGYAHNVHFTHAIQKYGWSNIKHEILLSGLTESEATKKEIELIALYKADDQRYGYNMSPGGSMPSVEARKKSSEANKLMTGELATRSKRVAKVDVNTLEIVHVYVNARQASLAAGSSMNALNLVCRHNAASEMKRATKGYFWCYEDDYTPELFAKYKGVKLTAKGKIPRTGERSSMLGRKFPSEAKQAISDSNSRAVVCVETGVTYKSIREAAAFVNGRPDAISKCLQGRSKTSAGLHWIYVEQ